MPDADRPVAAERDGVPDQGAADPAPHVRWRDDQPRDHELRRRQLDAEHAGDLASRLRDPDLLSALVGGRLVLRGQRGEADQPRLDGAAGALHGEHGVALALQVGDADAHGHAPTLP